MLMRPRGP
ncbi:hypothetical protein IEO21_08657 [Rhodonia placenta]|uniref:Uncharacterized protein n=1 Tax=Rhodonia placenta TaxID=104341 RepID=A0A8H7TYH9_9APHY|nr:hypothetical protein IEO21_08657 [Postia placenta]